MTKFRYSLLTLAALLALLVIQCNSSEPLEECQTDADCPESRVCDLAQNKCVVCKPVYDCKNRCCGDDGCGVTCTDTCQSGYECDLNTCMCATISYSAANVGSDHCKVFQVCCAHDGLTKRLSVSF